MKIPTYKKRPIGSIEALARTLRVSPKELLKLSQKADTCYSPNKPVIKPNGGVRQHYRVKPFLKKVQQRIIQQIFYNVDYPFYLQGSIKDEDNPRDYVKNASLHAGSRLLICEDISNFFPSIRSDIVLKVWQYFFHFPKDVAETLTSLTTFKGSVPQGAPTSPYIANLVLWEKEPQLEHEFQQFGFQYSRYVDDITSSINDPVTKDELQLVTTKIYGMLKSISVKPNRSKREVQTRARKMTVHKLNVNSGKPTLNKPARANIRAAVKQCEEMAKVDRTSKEYEKLHQSVTGRVAMMRRLHKNKAEKYLERLRAIKPISNVI